MTYYKRRQSVFHIFTYIISRHMERAADAALRRFSTITRLRYNSRTQILRKLTKLP